VLVTFTQEWERFCDALDKVGRTVDAVERAYGDLAGTRRRALERPLARVDELRRLGSSHPAAAAGPGIEPERLRVVP
jgi:DNA anti-recombination protein RmuC